MVGTKIGFGFLGEPKVPEIIKIARKAEAYGFKSIWMCETRFTREAISPLAAMAASTSKVKLGSAASNVFTRGVVLIAVTFATLDELSRGRMILGIGPGSPLILAKQGIRFDGALKRLKEYVEAFRMIIRGETVDYRGEFVNVTGASLDFSPPRKEIPVYLAVTGPKALRLAGRIADGVILNGFTSVSYAKRAIQRIKGAKSAGRNIEDLDIASSAIFSVKDDSKATKNSMRRLVATYLVNFPAIARESGVPAELLDSIRFAHANRGLDYALRLVPDSVIESLTVSGNPDEFVGRLREYMDAGVKRPVVMPIDSELELVMKTTLKA